MKGNRGLFNIRGRVITFSFLVLLVFLFPSAFYSQELSRPLLLGSWVAGEDPSEFLIHRVLEPSASHFAEDPHGTLVVRICTADDFHRAFVTTSLNPLSVISYNRFRSRIPEDKIFVSRSLACTNKKDSESKSEYWFVPGGKELQHDQIVPICHINSRDFVDFVSDEPGKLLDDQQFDRNVLAFINELKNDQSAKGMIIYSSTNEVMRRNLEKVVTLLTKEGLNARRVETIKAGRLAREDQKIKEKYPQLISFSIKTKQC